MKEQEQNTQKKPSDEVEMTIVQPLSEDHPEAQGMLDEDEAPTMDASVAVEQQASHPVDEAKALKEAIQEQAREDERPFSSNFTLRKILGGDILTAQLIRRQIWLIVLIVFFIIIYISNRYSIQKDLLEIDRLNTQLKDAKYKALSSSSLLTEKCRESHVLEMLKSNKDSILKMPSQPPYIIEIDN